MLRNQVCTVDIPVCALIRRSTFGGSWRYKACDLLGSSHATCCSQRAGRSHGGDGGSELKMETLFFVPFFLFFYLFLSPNSKAYCFVSFRWRLLCWPDRAHCQCSGVHFRLLHLPSTLPSDRWMIGQETVDLGGRNGVSLVAKTLDIKKHATL